jgi:hypothetical protein
VYVFAYSSRTDIPICTKLGMFIPWDQEEISERSKLQKNVLSSGHGEGSFCTRKVTTVEDRRQDPSGFFSARSQKQRPQTQKLPWVRVPAKIFPVIWKLMMIEDRYKQRCLFWRDKRNKCHNHEKISWVWVLVKMVLLYIQNYLQQMIVWRQIN